MTPVAFAASANAAPNPAPNAAPPGLQPGLVVESNGDAAVIVVDGSRRLARRAFSCAVGPLPGDEVLAWPAGAEWHVLAVIARRSPDVGEDVRRTAANGAVSADRDEAARSELPSVPHHDDESVSEGEAAAGRPYTRIDVPLTPNVLGSGTYLRLGAYVDGQEGALMPPLQLSKSVATNVSATAPTPDTSFLALLSGKNPYSAAAETANAASATSAQNADGSTKQGYLKRGDSFVKNKAGQMELLSISTSATTTTSSGDGFLGKTDADVNLTVGGGMLVDIVSGQTTNVSNGDIKFTAPAGVFAVNALSGVSITAGTATAPANISLLAYGYVKNEAKGPLSEWFYSTSEKKTYGFAKEWFYGEKYSEFHGTSTSYFYGKEEKTFHGTATSYFLGAQITTNLATRIGMTMAATLTLSLGTEFRLNASVDLKINLAVDMNIIIGIAFKMVLGADTKVVIGSDLKYVSAMDFKVVGIDGKAFQLELKNANMKSYFYNVLLRTGSFDMDGKATELKTGFFLKT